MRTFAIALGCLAWVLSCFDAVSYYRAGTQQTTLQTRLKAASSHAASAEASAGQDGAQLSVRIVQDQAAIDNDQRALERDAKLQLGDAHDRQTLAADQAALQADRMMQYTLENFSRTDPNPQVVAAENRVDLDRKLLAETVATRKRDLKLSHALIAFWALVAGAGLIAFRGIREKQSAEEVEDEEPLDAESEGIAAEEHDG